MPYWAPFFFVNKKDGSMRPCQDYRDLNNRTIKDVYPLPLIGDLVERLQGSTIFTKLDLWAGYNNVCIKGGDEHKAALKTSRELFEPLVILFGMCNSPATFQKMMNELFKDMVDEGWLLISMDYMLIHSSNKEIHHKRTLQVLERLQKHNLFLKPEKCQFELT